MPAIEKARLYRGRGGETMRGATCRVLEVGALLRMPAGPKAALAKLEWYRLFTVYPPSEDDKDFDMLDITGHVGDLADLTAEAAAAAVNAAPSLARGDVANRFASILSGAAKAQLVASVPGLSPRAPSKGGGFEYF